MQMELFPMQSAAVSHVRISVSAALALELKEKEADYGVNSPVLLTKLDLDTSSWRNVSALLGRGLGTILEKLASIGHDAEWHCIPAFSLDAPHPRDRVWIVAYPSEIRRIKRQILYPNFLERFRKSQQTWNESWSHPGISLRDGRKIPHYLFERVDDGFSDRLDRIGAIGNAVVPQIAEMIGHAIMAAE